MNMERRWHSPGLSAAGARGELRRAPLPVCSWMCFNVTPSQAARVFLCQQARGGRQAPHTPPSWGGSHGESLSAPFALGMSPSPRRTHASARRSWSGRAEEGVGRAVNHLCFLLISRAARDQPASSWRNCRSKGGKRLLLCMISVRCN